MHHANEKAVACWLEQVCKGVGQLSEGKNSFLRKAETAPYIWSQGFDSSKVSSSSSQLGLLCPQGRNSHPRRWAVFAWCLLHSAPRDKTQHKKLLGKHGATSSLWQEYPGMVPGTAGSDRVGTPTVPYNNDISYGRIFPEERAYITLKSHSCCSNIPHSKMQFQNRNHSMPKQQNSICCETSCQIQDATHIQYFF